MAPAGPLYSKVGLCYGGAGSDDGHIPVLVGFFHPEAALRPLHIGLHDSYHSDMQQWTG